MSNEESTNMEIEISKCCEEIKQFLLSKNAAYGNSAANPMRVFSKVNNIEQLNIRIDDKLSRIARGDRGFSSEDTELDLIGYLILKRCVLKQNKNATISIS